MSDTLASMSRARKSGAGQLFGDFSVQGPGKTDRTSGTIDRTSVRLGRIAADLVRSACPQKPAANLAAWAGLTPRAAEHILGGRNGLSLDAFFRLLHSPIGRDLWDAAWAIGPMPDWHAKQTLLLEIAEAERRADEARAEYAALRQKISP